MESLIEGKSAREILDGFFRRLSTPGEIPLLLCDYDGTLSPFVEDRSEARPYPGLVDILEKIRSETTTRLVIISGRGVEDILPLLGMDPPPEIWGSHGLERYRGPKDYEKLELPAKEIAKLEEAAESALEIVDAERVEVKPAGVALHFRGVDSDQTMEEYFRFRQEWELIAYSSRLEVCDFDGGLEIRDPEINKGRAVRKLLDEQKGALSAYLGDDLTDEDAFREMPDFPGGLSILVREELRESAADLRITPPGELENFLDRWISVTLNR